MTYPVLSCSILAAMLAGLLACDASKSKTKPTEYPSQLSPDDSSDQSQRRLQTCYQASDFICQVEAAIIDKSNQLRRSNGQQELSQSFELSYVARLWSEQQAQAGQLSHDGFPEARLDRLEEEFGTWGPILLAENVGFGIPSSTDPEAIATYMVDLWAASSGHRRNLLGDFQSIGVGVYRDGGKLFATQIFY